MVVSKYYKISNSYQKRIVLISDVHFYNKNMLNTLYQVLEKIKSMQPNYICIVGDLVDDKNIKDKDDLLKWIQELSKICKVMISIGNHEFYFNHEIENNFDTQLFDKIDRLKNVFVLNNRIHSECGINFIGVTLPSDYYDSGEQANDLIYFMNKKFPRLDRTYNIVLCHSPYQIAKQEVLENLKCGKNIDLILSGHMHAGLAFEWSKKILKGRGIITPQMHFFQKYCYGIYNYQKTSIIISSGITKLSKSHKVGILNILYKPEIVVIDI